MTGAEMMLKAIGIDPEEIRGAANGIREVLVAIKNGQDRIEARINSLEEKLNERQLEPGYSDASCLNGTSTTASRELARSAATADDAERG